PSNLQSSLDSFPHKIVKFDRFKECQAIFTKIRTILKFHLSLTKCDPYLATVVIADASNNDSEVIVYHL
ncbi:hypothetical protein WUBG_13327, partial [Wuchereria bancrofti]